MSVINRMLQDLDARGVEATGGSVYGEQVRVVAAKRHSRMHSAWLLVLVLSLTLSGVVAWIFFRSQVNVVNKAQDTQLLPLKLDSSGLNLAFLDAGKNSSPHHVLSSAEPALTPDQGGSAEPIHSVADMPQSTVAPLAEGEGTSSVSHTKPEKATPLTKRSPTPPVLKKKIGAVESDLKKLLPPAVFATSAHNHSVSSSFKEDVGRGGSLQAEPNGVLETHSHPNASLEAEVAKPLPAALPVPEKTSEPIQHAAILTKHIDTPSPQQRAEDEYRHAVDLMQQEKGAEAAISILKQVLQFNPQHTAARLALIGALLVNKRQDEAIHMAKEGLDLDKKQSALAMILARLQVEKGKLRPAIETLERTLPYASNPAVYQAFLAALLQQDNRHKEAAEHYLQALQRAPQNGVWWMGLGISFQAENRLAEAQEAFKRARETNTLSPELQDFVDTRLKQLQR